MKLKRNWIHWRRGKEDRVLTKLIATELQSSKKTLINLWQMKSYPLEYAGLYSSKQVSKSSKLLILSPFTNDERVRCVELTSKNQMIVSKSHYPAAG